ncbi:MAG: GNAT family N-acetyltransferase [Fimbriimonas sp.]|nr:GNAT family N-acetyltransferase [Fimbriimonas sp.]
MDVRIVREGPERLPDYESVPIAYESNSRVDLARLAADGTVVEVPSPERVKDYDAVLDERPTSLAIRFEMESWGIFAAFDGEARLGGIIVAPGGQGYALCGDFPFAAVIVDVRVDPRSRGMGIGCSLLSAGLSWLEGLGDGTVLVETQDTNPAACRFYWASGFGILSIAINGYGDGIDEAKLIWRRDLTRF